MSRILNMLLSLSTPRGERSLSSPAAVRFDDAVTSSGWHESSHDLRLGLVVVEEADCGPETRPYTYVLDQEPAPV